MPLCERHHHLVYEGGWTLEVHAGRRITVHQTDGTITSDGVTTDRRPTAAAVCRRQRPPPTTPAEVAEDLELAIHGLGANTP